MPYNGKYSKEIIGKIILNSKSWADVCRKLGIKPATGSQSYIKKVALRFEIDFSHFIGKTWNRGRTFPIKSVAGYLIEDSSIGSHILKIRLFRLGIKEKKCEDCGVFEWFGNELPLELDHINGKSNDCRIENLRVLCPNCHAVKTRKQRQTRVAE